MLKHQRSITVILVLTTILLMSGVDPVQGQEQVRRGQSLPNDKYYSGFGEYYRGEYSRALAIFRSGANGAYRDGTGRFLDSICFYTMTGECFYQMGSYPEAIEQYEAAIALYTNLKSWPQRTTFPTQILENSGAVAQARINWGNTTRQFTVGAFPKLSMMIGDLDAVERARIQGGVINPASLRQVDIAEVMRCVALAIHRRHQIKGPVCKHDPFTKSMVSQLGVGRGAAGTMTGAWQGVLYGLAQSSAAQYDQAAATLTQSLQISGFDHPSSPIALLELGYLAKRKGDLTAALLYFLEASYSGAIFRQYDVVADALHAATNVQIQADRTIVFTPLQSAAEWANRERARALHASLLGDAIWSTTESGASGDALRLISQNARVLRQGDLASSRIGTRWLYGSALANSMDGNATGAARDLERFLIAARKSSLWLYQIALADDLVVKSRVTERAADILYSEVLRDPGREDWLEQPMETIAYLVSPHLDPMLRWHGINVRLKSEVKALEISDLIRRHRFFSVFPLGGRQLALRWVTSAPAEALNETAQHQQTEFLTRYPRLKELADASQQVTRQLRQIPVTPDRNTEAVRDQKKWLDQLSVIEAEREMLLQSLALRREPCEMAFPAPMMLQTIQDRLPEKQLIIAIFFDREQYYISFISKNTYSFESIIAAQLVDQELALLLKDLGLGTPGGTITADNLQSDGWRESARKISALLFPRVRPDFINNFDEIIVVPDGPLWYFPFELVQLGTSEHSVNLSDSIKVRYAPTLSTAVADDRRRRRFAKTVAITGRTNARDDNDLSSRAFADLQTRISGVESIDKSSRTPSNLIKSFVGQVIVWDEIDGSKPAGLATAPMSFDSGRPGSSLGSWLSLPWSDIDQLILPGYKSAIGGGKLQNAQGDELFLLSCGLLATGTKSALISRWPVGGTSTMDFTQRFAAESLHSPPIDALRRSIQLLRETEIDLASEPRVRDTKLDEPLKADHPLFWASYLWIDVVLPDLEEPEVEEGVDDDKQSNPEVPSAEPERNDDKQGGAAEEMKEGGGDGISATESDGHREITNQYDR